MVAYDGRSHRICEIDLDRRRFIKWSAVTSAIALTPVSSLYAAVSKEASRTLHLYNPTTRETIRVAYYQNNGYQKDALEEINHLMRDYHTGEILPIDKKLLDLLDQISRKTGSRSPLHVISGYRSPATNEMLRRRSKRVARKSLHLKGKAADIRLPGFRTSSLRRIAMNLKQGGVGYYPRSGFIHVDTGAIRYW